MRRRERLPAALADVPPAGLRRFGDGFASREEWVGARREWEAEHRITLDDWWDDLNDDALQRHAPRLADFYAAIALFTVESEMNEDPRLWSDQDIADANAALVREIDAAYRRGMVSG